MRNKRYYALSDSLVGDYPAHSSDGYRKEVIFFLSARLRDEWLKVTKLVSARPLSRAEALKYSRRRGNGDRTVRPVQNPGEEFAGYYEVIRESRSRY